MAREGVSSEWLDAQEDRMALVLAAKDGHLLRLRLVFDALYRGGYIEEQLYRDCMTRLDQTTEALLAARVWGGWVMRYPPDLGKL